MIKVSMTKSVLEGTVHIIFRSGWKMKGGQKESSELSE